MYFMYTTYYLYSIDYLWLQYFTSSLWMYCDVTINIDVTDLIQFISFSNVSFDSWLIQRTI